MKPGPFILASLLSLAAFPSRAQETTVPSPDLPEATLPAERDRTDALLMVADLSLSWEDYISTRESIGFTYSNLFIDIGFSLAVNNDQKYGADIANMGDGTFFGNYFLMDEGGVALSWNGLSFDIGRYARRDPVGGPYSLFINSGGPSTVSSRLAFESDVFSYESVWLELTSGSACETAQWPAGFPDRGANVKTYTFHLSPDMRFGLQDAAVYTKRSFDFEYFASPMPQYFIQYVKGTAGRPWTTGANENNMIGAFWDWETERASFSVQTLVDDFSIHFLVPSAPNQPWKAAWALDASFVTDAGEFGFHHAGATKHTFQPSVQDQTDPEGMAYGYTYYPDVRFLVDGKYRTISIEDNMIGYRHGENNLAFMADWTGELGGFDASAALEYVISGAKSPGNPWHELDGAVDYSGTKVITDATLEHRVLFSLEMERAFGPTLFYGSLSLGYVWNELQIVAPGGPANAFTLDDIYLFKPSDICRPLFALTVGVKAELDLIELLGLGR